MKSHLGHKNYISSSACNIGLATSRGAWALDRGLSRGRVTETTSFGGGGGVKRFGLHFVHEGIGRMLPVAVLVG